MAPTIFVFGIMQPTNKMGVVVKSIGSGLSFVVILAVVTSGCLFFGSLANNSEFVVCMLNNLL
jgi:hypothetical protein